MSTGGDVFLGLQCKYCSSKTQSVCDSKGQQFQMCPNCQSTCYFGQWLQGTKQTKAQEWEARYPNYCHKCGAEGYIHWTENLGPTGECWLASMSDLCEDCVLAEVPKCPRCGGNWYSQFLYQARHNMTADQKFHPQAAQVLKTLADELFNDWLDKEEPCPHCGWNWGNGPEDYKPYDPEQDCPY